MLESEDKVDHMDLCWFLELDASYTLVMKDWLFCLLIYVLYLFFFVFRSLQVILGLVLCAEFKYHGNIKLL